MGIPAQLPANIKQQQVWRAMCIYSHMGLSCHQKTKTPYKQAKNPNNNLTSWASSSLRKTNSVFWKHCFVSNFFQNSEKQVKEVHNSKSAHLSDYRHEIHCFAYVFIDIWRDQDDSNTEFAFSSTFLRTDRRAHNFLQYNTLKQIWI